VGVALSWLAVRGKSPESVLTELGFRATGEQEEFPRSPATGSQLPAGWFAVIIRGRAVRMPTTERSILRVFRKVRRP